MADLASWAPAVISLLGAAATWGSLWTTVRAHKEWLTSLSKRIHEEGDKRELADKSITERIDEERNKREEAVLGIAQSLERNYVSYRYCAVMHEQKANGGAKLV